MPLWAVWICAGFACIGGFFLLPAFSLPRNIVYDLVAAASAPAILYGVRRNQPVMKTAWYLVAAAQGFSTLGNICFAYYVQVLHESPFPSLADVFFLAGGPPLVAGLFLTVRGRGSGRDRAGLLDASVIATGLALLSWTFLMRPVTDDVSLDLVARLVSLAYPTVDVLLLAMVARLLFSPGTRALIRQPVRPVIER